MEYKDPRPLNRSEAEAALRSDDAMEIATAVVSVALHDPDWQWAQDQAMRLLAHPDPGIRGVAATSLGHIARLHGRLDPHAIEALRGLLQDAEVSGRAADALEDVERFGRGM